MNITTKTPQKSREYLGIFQNAKRLGDSAPASPIEVGISRIKANFGINCQDKPNFVARVGLGTVQKSDFSGGEL